MKNLAAWFAGIGVLFQFVLCAFMVFAIQFMANYSLNTIFGHTVNPLIAFVLGLVIGPFNFIVFVICLVLHAAGIHLPLVHP